MRLLVQRRFKKLGMLAVVIVVTATLSSCAKTIDRSKLQTDWNLTEQSDLFHQKSGLDRYRAIFVYNVDTGAVVIQNVNPKTLTPGYFRKLYSDNAYSLRNNKTVTDCLTVYYNGMYSNKNEASFSACPGTEYDFDWTLFRKKGDHKDFGPAIIAALNKEIPTSCSVSDFNINVWYIGECINNLANGQGIAVGRDKYMVRHSNQCVTLFFNN